jgi:hypothetical protein
VRLLWEDAARAAGITFGRAGTRERLARREKEGEETAVSRGHFLLPMMSGARWLFLNTTYGDVERFCHEDEVGSRGWEEKEREIRRGPQLQAAPSPSLRVHPGLDQESSFLFDYCELFLATFLAHWASTDLFCQT